MKQNENSFDMFSQDYRKIHTDNINGVSGTDSDYFSEYKIRELFNRSEDMGILPDGKWLDLGCGDGNSARFIKKWFKDVEYHGIDISEESVRKAREINPECSFQAYDGEVIPFDDNSFDVVFVATVMHHIPLSQWESILEECKRVLKFGGLLVIFEHNPLNPLTRKLVELCPFDEKVILIPAIMMKSVVNRVGFRNTRLRYTIFMPRKIFFYPLLWIEKHLWWCGLGGQYYLSAEKKID